MKIRNFLVLVLLIFMSSCAYLYTPIQSNEIKYSETENILGTVTTEFSVDNVFKTSGNKRLCNKMTRKKIYPISIQIENNTDRVIYFDSLNIEVFNDLELVDIISNKKVYNKVKQPYYLYSLYSLGLLTSFTASPDGIDFYFKYPLFIYPPISLANMSVAIYNNQKLKKDIKQNTLSGTMIQPNCHTTGIIFIKIKELKDIKIRVNEN